MLNSSATSNLKINMLQQDLSSLFNIIRNSPNTNESNEMMSLLFKMASDSIALDALKNTPNHTSPALPIQSRVENSTAKTSLNENRFKKKGKGFIKFSQQELSIMPKQFTDIFIVNDKVVKYRYYEGLFQARYRREGLHIEVASKSYDVMKKKFIQKLNQILNPSSPVTIIERPFTPQPKKKSVLFGEYGEGWLLIIT